MLGTGSFQDSSVVSDSSNDIGSVSHLEGPASSASSSSSDCPYDGAQNGLNATSMVGSLYPITVHQRPCPELWKGETRLTPRTKNERVSPPNATVNVDGRKGEKGRPSCVLKTTLPAGDPRRGQSAWCAQQICSSNRDRPTVSGYVMYTSGKCGTGSGAES